MATEDRVYLLDANVLVYASNLDSPRYSVAQDLREKARTGEIKACVCPQVLYEFFSVITDSRRVDHPLSPEQAIAEVDKYYKAKKIRKIYPQKATDRRIIELVRRYGVRRQEIFDVKLVATMLDNNVSAIYTGNKAHFKRFKEVGVIDPFE